MRRFLLLALFALCGSQHALAGSILFVSDTTTDSENIPAVLSGGSAEVAHPTIAGAAFRPAASGAFHDVTIVRDDFTITNPVQFAAEGTNPTLAGANPNIPSLNPFVAIYWSASGPHEPDTLGGGVGADGGVHSDAAVFTSLGDYVSRGGFVLVTGHDAVTDPTDILLTGFVGGAGATAAQLAGAAAAPGAVGAGVNFLSTGVTDIRGQLPGGTQAAGVSQTSGVQDLDVLTLVDSNTASVVSDAGLTGAQWTIRVPTGLADLANADEGQIAYLAAGVPLFEDLPFNPGTFLSDGEDPGWTDDPVYQAALLNWANAASMFPVPEPGSLLLLGTGVALLGGARRRGPARRR